MRSELKAARENTPAGELGGTLPLPDYLKTDRQ
jgi:hypothetical protein